MLDPRLDPDRNWRPRYYFVAAVKPEFALFYPTLKPRCYYPTGAHPTQPAKAFEQEWLMPTRDIATWVLVDRAHVDYEELEPGDAWEGEKIQAMEPPG